MTNYEKIYWLTRADYIQGFFIGAAVVFGLMIAARSFNWIILKADGDDGGTPFILSNRIWRVTVCALFVISTACACLVPSRNEAIIILAGGKTMDYIQSDTSLSKLPYQTTSLISTYFDKALKEMKEEKKK